MFKKILTMLMVIFILVMAGQIATAQATRQFFYFQVVDVNGEVKTDEDLTYSVDSDGTIYSGSTGTDEVTNDTTLPDDGILEFWKAGTTFDLTLEDSDGNIMTFEDLTPRDTKLTWVIPFSTIAGTILNLPGLDIDDDDELTFGDDDDAVMRYDETTDDAFEIVATGGITIDGATDFDDGITVDEGELTVGSNAFTTLVNVYKETVDVSGGGTAQTEALLTLPEDSILLEVIAFTQTAMDGDSTTTLEVGVSGNVDNYIDSADYDESTINTFTSMTGGSSNDVDAPEVVNAATELIATWTNTASATAGAVEVTVIYIP